jgi:hypothetical protein
VIEPLGNRAAPGLNPEELGGTCGNSRSSDAATALSACLFELRAAQEAELRALTSIQCSLERVRSGASVGEAELLLGEMSRLLDQSSMASGTIADRRGHAAELIASIRDQRTPVRTRSSRTVDVEVRVGADHDRPLTVAVPVGA